MAHSTSRNFFLENSLFDEHYFSLLQNKLSICCPVYEQTVPLFFSRVTLAQTACLDVMDLQEAK